MAYSLGLLGFCLVKVLAPGYFARQDTKTPVRSASSRCRSTWPQRRRRGACLPERIFGTAYPARDVDRPLGAGQRDAAVSGSAPRWHLPAVRGLAAAPAADRARERCHGGVPLVGCRRLAAWTDWHAPRRALWLGISVVGGAVVYFGVLAPCRRAPARPEASIIAGHFPIRQGHADSTWFRALSRRGPRTSASRSATSTASISGTRRSWPSCESAAASCGCRRPWSASSPSRASSSRGIRRRRG